MCITAHSVSLLCAIGPCSHTVLLEMLFQLHYFLLILFYCGGGWSSAEKFWKHTIYVAGDTGNKNQSCSGDVDVRYCTSLMMALNELKYDSTLILISPGVYSLETLARISDLSHIAIVGNGSKETEVKCNSQAGIEIASSTDVTIDSITFDGCNYRHKLKLPVFNSNNRCLHYKSVIPAALYLKLSHGVLVTNVNITNSHGTGLLLHQVYGSTIVSNCFISNCFGDFKGKLTFDTTIPDCIGTYYEIGSYYINYLDSMHDDDDYSENIFDGDCSINQPGGAITMFDPSGTVSIDSSIVSNNFRGFFILQEESSNVFVTIRNTAISSNIYSSTIMIENGYTMDVTGDSTIDNFNIVTGYSLQYQVVGTHDILKLIHTSPIVQVNITLPFYPDLKFQYIIGYGGCSQDFSVDEFQCKDTHGNHAECPVPYINCYLDDSDNQSCCDNHADQHSLCGKCIEGYGVAINSPYLSCVECDGSAVAKGWGILILVEFIPVTVMVALIAILNINLNQGSLKAYVFFCQLLTIPFPSVGYPAWVDLLWASDFGDYDYFLQSFANFFPFPFSLWNLDFVSLPKYVGSNSYNRFFLCVSQSTSPLLAITFWYVVGFLPFILLALLYLCIILYDNGNQCVVCLIRPFHRLLARFWRMFNITPSLTHTVASIYTLCFTQLAAVSLKLLHSSRKYNKDGDFVETVFFYDGSQKYFHHWHGAAAILAMIVLAVFIIPPTIYLTVYPFKWFQKCFNKIKFKKDFLVSVTDVFMGPFKDGTGDSWEYRYFAGVYFVLQLLLLTSYTLPLSTFFFVAISDMCFCGLFAIVIIIFRPYKRNVHTFTQVFLLAILITSNGISSASILFLNSLHFLTLVFSLYCLIWLLRKCKYAYKNRSNATKKPVGLINSSPNTADTREFEDDCDLFADRIMNPDGYSERHVSEIPLLESRKNNEDYETF